MGKRAAALLLAPALLLPPALRLVLGGWAVVTLDQLPEYLVAKQPNTLSFMVRQHGVTPMNEVHPTLEGRSGGRTIQGNVVRGTRDGQYVASFTLPETGDWTLTINSGWGVSKLTLQPIRTIAPGSPPPVALAAAVLGRNLFVGKGCVGCHTRTEAQLGVGEKIGPELSGKRYTADFLRKFLADPPANPTMSGTFRMPNLGLRPAEIAALTVFLNSDAMGTDR